METKNRDKGEFEDNCSKFNITISSLNYRISDKIKLIARTKTERSKAYQYENINMHTQTSGRSAMSRHSRRHVPGKHGALSDNAHRSRVQPRPEENTVLTDVVRYEAGAVFVVGV